MRKLVSIVLAFVFILSFAACKDDSSQVLSTTLPTSAASQPKYELKNGEGIHTIAFVSDTQRYAASKDNAELIKAIVDTKDKYNVEYLVHTGDLVMSPDKETEWQNARGAMDLLNGVIPYGVLAGNHDQVSGDTPLSNYSKYFGDFSYKDCSYFGGSFEDGRAHYQLITIGDTEFIFVYVCDDPSKGCIAFANDAFAKYPDRIGVLCTHKYLEEDCELDEMGEYMFENIVKPNKNVYMVLCGHESAAGYLETKIDEKRTVLQIMADYQDAGNKGTLMYLQFDQAAKTLTGISYSPLTGSYDGYKNLDTDQFQVRIPW